MALTRSSSVPAHLLAQPLCAACLVRDLCATRYTGHDKPDHRVTSAHAVHATLCATIAGNSSGKGKHTARSIGQTPCELSRVLRACRKRR